MEGDSDDAIQDCVWRVIQDQKTQDLIGNEHFF